ncbi:hypothetical protein V6N11_006486 [Hibiscus sabdariffa]|uniref:Uncharacterized protein n=1 Tax=Hibiscus sabdariffa TaxID=183260 RepID=A0ABR2RQZ6_9ROSI
MCSSNCLPVCHSNCCFYQFKRHEAEYYSLQSQLTFMYPKHVFVRVFCNLDVDRLIKLCSCMNWEVVYGSIATVLLL